MKKYSFESYKLADIGDYLKVFACSAVMSQPIMSLIMGVGQPYNTQDIFGVMYNLVKYTAPAFIFGILYTTIRTNDIAGSFSYQKHLQANWSNLFIPTIWWTLIYLLGMPWLQQIRMFNNFGTFSWQFVNGNAAPHLWYNTMILQFILLMPLFWGISRYVGNNVKRGLSVAGITFVLYFAWLWFYDFYVFHGSHEKSWYLLDRIFISFLIYGVFGVLAWQLRDYVNTFLYKFWWLILIGFTVCFFWTNFELHGFGHPVLFTNAPYYKPSMTFYCLAVIALIAALCLFNVRHKSEKCLKVFHFLATYAYRAYLSNVFWDQLLWNNLDIKQQAIFHPFIAFFICWLLTWILSFVSAYFLHIAWTETKELTATLIKKV